MSKSEPRAIARASRVESRRSWSVSFLAQTTATARPSTPRTTVSCRAWTLSVDANAASNVPKLSALGSTSGPSTGASSSTVSTRQVPLRAKSKGSSSSRGASMRFTSNESRPSSSAPLLHSPWPPPKPLEADFFRLLLDLPLPLDVGSSCANIAPATTARGRRASTHPFRDPSSALSCVVARGLVGS